MFKRDCRLGLLVFLLFFFHVAFSQVVIIELKQDVNNPLESNYLDQYAFDSLDPNKPFGEVVYGIDNIFKLFRIQAFHRLTYLDHGNPARFRLLASLNFHF